MINGNNRQIYAIILGISILTSAVSCEKAKRVQSSNTETGSQQVLAEVDNFDFRKQYSEEIKQINVCSTSIMENEISDIESGQLPSEAIRKCQYELYRESTIKDRLAEVVGKIELVKADIRLRCTDAKKALSEVSDATLKASLQESKAGKWLMEEVECE